MAADVNKWASVVGRGAPLHRGDRSSGGDEANDAEMLAGAGWSLAAPGARRRTRARRGA
jgi:hypothetical protein